MSGKNWFGAALGTLLIVASNWAYSALSISDNNTHIDRGVVYSNLSYLTASGGVAPYGFVVNSGLPSGITVASDGTLSGETCGTNGSFSISATVTDSTNASLTKTNLSMIVNAAPTGGCALSFSSSSLPNGTARVAYSATVTATGGTSPYTYSVASGSLPTGLTLNSSTGAISGTPTTVGTYAFTISASDSSSSTGSQTYSVTINAPTITVSPTSLSAGAVGTSYSQAFGASGGTGPYTYSVTSGALPAGLSLSSGGVLSGTPTAAATASFTITATDAFNFTGAQALSLTISAAAVASAANSTVSASPSSVTANGSSTSTITVTLKDGSGNPVSGKTVTLAAGSGSSTITTVSGTTNASGVASFTVKDAVTESVTYTATDTTDSIAVTQTASVTFAAGTVSAANSTASASPTSVAANGSSTSTITVTLKDTNGNPVSGKTVTLAASGGNSTITTVSGTTNGSGVATFTVKDSVAESVNYTATDTTDSVAITQTASVTFTAGGVSAANSTVTASPTSVAADGSSTSTITVMLKDGSGNPVSGKSVTLAASGGSSTITTVSSTTSASGVASFTVKDSVAESVTYTATDTTDSISVTQTASVTFAAGTVSAANSTASASPTSVAANGSSTSTITVTLKDGSGNPVSGKTVTLAAGSGSSTITTVSGTTNASGVASFTVKDSVAESVTYTATDTTDSVAVTQTASVTFTAGAVSASTSTASASPTSVVANGSSTSTITVTLKDTNGNPVSGKTVTLAASGGNSTITTVSGTTNGSGVASFTVKDSVAESVNYTATDTTDSVAVTQTAGVTFTLMTAPAVAMSFSPAANTVNGTSMLTTTITNPGAAAITGVAFAVTYPANLKNTASPGVTSTCGGTAAGAANGAALTLTAATVPASGSCTVSVAVTSGVAGSYVTSTGAVTSINAAASAPASATLTINASVVTVNPARLPVGTVGIPYSQTVTAVGGTGPYTFAVTSGALPAGLTLSGNGALTGTPTGAVSTDITITATDANGNTGSRLYTFTTLASRPDPTQDPDVRGIQQAQVSSLTQQVGAQITNVARRLEELHDAVGSFENRLCVSVRQDPARPDERGGVVPVCPEDNREPSGRVSGWMTGTVEYGRAQQASSDRFSARGLTFGGDYRVSATATVGVALGYGFDSTDVGEDGSRVDARSADLIVYGGWKPIKAIYVDALVGYGSSSFDTDRWVALDGTLVGGNRSANQMFTSVMTTARLDVGPLALSPYARADLLQARLNGYQESGNSSLALAYDSSTLRASTLVAGVKLSYPMQLGFGAVEPSLRAEYQQHNDSGVSQGMTYADQPLGQRYSLDQPSSTQNVTAFGAAVRVRVRDTVSAGLEYQANYGSGEFLSRTLRANLIISF